MMPSDARSSPISSSVALIIRANRRRASSALANISPTWKSPFLLQSNGFATSLPTIGRTCRTRSFQRTVRRVSTRLLLIYARMALGVAFLSAVADRFGWWGAPGARNVAWGDFRHFLAYTGKVNPYLSASLVPALGWFATACEIVLGVALIAGFHLRWTALLSGFLLLAF